MSLFDQLRGGSRKPAAPRQLVLGLDWGTSSTKMVLRDYSVADERGLGRAYVLRPAADASERYPSAVTEADGRLWFGSAALEKRAPSSRRLDTLKTSILKAGLRAVPRRTSGELGVHDLAVGALAHMIAVGRRSAERLAGLTGQVAELEVIVGVPVSATETPTLYAEMARRARIIAMSLGFDPQGCTADELEHAIEASLAPEHGTRIQAGSSEAMAWVRPELAAGLYWPYRNPQTAEGLYAAVDLGAGTTNVSFFRLGGQPTAQGWVRRSMVTIYASNSVRTGMNDLNRALGQHVGKKPGALRGLEAGLLRDAGPRGAVGPVLDEIMKGWRDCWRAAYRKEAANERWNGMRILTFGGGSLIPTVRERFALHPNQPRNTAVQQPPIDAPADLYELPTKAGETTRFRGVPTFALVAYGLAVRPGDFAQIWLPGEVEGYRPADDLPRRKSVDVDDLYPK